MKIIEARFHQKSRFLILLLTLMGMLVNGCNQQSPPPIASRPVQGIVATLEDKVQELPNQRIAWSTYWKLCWDKYPEAIGYELQTVTGEGKSPKLRQQTSRCFLLQTAAGNNKKSQGLLNRDAILSFQAAQLSYRVRAVLKGDRKSQWSPAWSVGEPTPQTPSTKTN